MIKVKINFIPRISRKAMVGLLALGLGGCGGKEFAEVEGVITLDGKPLPEVQVVFVPDPFKGNVGNNSLAVTDSEGRYRLFAARDERHGTVIGPHRVMIVDLTQVVDTTSAGEPAKPGQSAASSSPGAKPRRFSGDYSDVARTPLQSVEVTSGAQTLNFDLKGLSSGGQK
jgi:hypothetical protein